MMPWKDEAYRKAYHRKYYIDNGERMRASNKAYAKKMRADLKADVLAAYGPTCRCCGEAEPKFLALDHINNNGADERQRITGSRRGGGASVGWAMYKRLKKAGWPQGYQILCFNCNWAKHLGVCPHAEAS